VKVERLQLRGSEGLTLIADARGDPAAPSVLLMHGGGQTRHAWGGTAEVLARDGRYSVSVDLRGHGDSDWSPSGDYRVAAFTADMLALLQVFQRPPVVVGASLGGVAALLGIGETQQPHASGLVLVDISTRVENTGTQRISEFMLARPDGFADLGEVAAAIAGFTRQRRREPNPESLAKNVRRGPDGRYHWHWDPRFMRGELRPFEITDRPRLLRAAHQLRVPALLVRGRESDVISPEGAREFLEAAPGAEFVDVSGAGHMVAGDRNDAFTEAVRSFLDRIAPVR
jgi:non-heme chloroperoxidase